VTAEFDPIPESVTRARDLVRGMAGVSDALEALMTIVSELASNAVRHARTRFRVSVQHRDHIVRVEVTDRGDGVPVVRNPDPLEPGGRGLVIVAAVAHRWGVVRGTTDKTVWAELHSRSDRA
jgi:anti-sigma regulatory factor (Ser/Thr protein kinase)